MNTPKINVTPLIDVLLVLLIIFMVVSPLRPNAFKSKIPHELQNKVETNIHTLVVSIGSDLSLRLNAEADLGTVDDTAKLTERLRDVFKQRSENMATTQSTEHDQGFASPDGIERTVFIKAPKGMSYGKVVKVVDAVKLAGAAPISLQIDGLD